MLNVSCKKSSIFATHLQIPSTLNNNKALPIGDYTNDTLDSDSNECRLRR